MNGNNEFVLKTVNDFLLAYNFKHCGGFNIVAMLQMSRRRGELPLGDWIDRPGQLGGALAAFVKRRYSFAGSRVTAKQQSFLNDPPFRVSSLQLVKHPLEQAKRMAKGELDIVKVETQEQVASFMVQALGDTLFPPPEDVELNENIEAAVALLLLSKPSSGKAREEFFAMLSEAGFEEPIGQVETPPLLAESFAGFRGGMALEYLWFVRRK